MQQPSLTSFFAKKPLVSSSSLRQSITGQGAKQETSEQSVLDEAKCRKLNEISQSQQVPQTDLKIRPTQTTEKRLPLQESSESEEMDFQRRRSRKQAAIKEESDEEFQINDSDVEDKQVHRSAVQFKTDSSRPSGIAANKARQSAPVVKQQKQKVKPGPSEESEIVDQEDQHIGGGFQNEQEIYDSLPKFLQPEHIRDKNKRKIGEPGYDPTTLFIPPQDWKDFTPGMHQYWEIKQDHFEKIFFFKLGKFYEIFYNDAIICQRLLDLNWMGGGKKLHIGFPEKVLDKYLQKMVDHGFKVAVIEQTENPRQLEARLKVQKENRVQNLPKSNKVVNRQICNMVTKGTFKSQEQTYQPKYVLAVKKHGAELGVCFFDVTTLKVQIGQFADDEQMSKLRTLVCQIRPVEVLHEAEAKNSDLLKILRNSPQPPIFQSMPIQRCWTFSKTVVSFEKYFKDTSVPEVLLEIKNKEEDLAMGSYGMAAAFLEDALIADQILSRGLISRYEPESKLETSTVQNMVLDAQALQHLEIVEGADGKQAGSLFNYIDHCVTPFGKRQLKRWLLAPLLDVDEINQRLDAVEDMIQHQHETDVLRARLSKLPDLEKSLARIFSDSVKHSVKAIYFEDVNLAKMKEFRQLLSVFSEMNNTLEIFSKLGEDLTSKRLISLVTVQEEGGLVPDNIREAVEEFDSLIVWKSVAGPTSARIEVPEPKTGIDPEFDAANEAVNLIKEELEEFCATMQKQYHDRRICFSHAKQRYEIEIPEQLVKGNLKPKDFELQSQRAGYQRFYTPFLKQTVERLEFAEDRLKDAITPFLTSIFLRFYQKREIWLQSVQILSELDCLASLAIVSGQADNPMTRPVFREHQPGQKGYLNLKEMVHPCVAVSSNKRFIPNDALIDCSNNQELLLVTGPNMGGKSTLLRQTCIAVILAQIGAFVPAKTCELTPVDRIFTRIGASDRILEGKSTFYVEMEETKTILKFATSRSLAIVDELGRGTSTFDGYAIANAVMRHMVGKINCMALFSTHYHMLINEFKQVRGVKNFHMAFKQTPGSDQIVFLYKFIEGECPSSFGINVALLAGLPPGVIKTAKLKSLEFGSRLDEITEKAKLMEL